MRISDWSSDVCSSDLLGPGDFEDDGDILKAGQERQQIVELEDEADLLQPQPAQVRSEEHTSELQSLMRISYAVFCLKKKTQQRPYSHSSRTSTQSTPTNYNQKPHKYIK